MQQEPHYPVSNSSNYLVPHDSYGTEKGALHRPRSSTIAGTAGAWSSARARESRSSSTAQNMAANSPEPPEGMPEQLTWKPAGFIPRGWAAAIKNKSRNAKGDY